MSGLLIAFNVPVWYFAEFGDENSIVSSTIQIMSNAFFLGWVLRSWILTLCVSVDEIEEGTNKSSRICSWKTVINILTFAFVYCFVKIHMMHSVGQAKNPFLDWNLNF